MKRNSWFRNARVLVWIVTTILMLVPGRSVPTVPGILQLAGSPIELEAAREQDRGDPRSAHMILVMNTSGAGEAPLSPGSDEDESDSGDDGDSDGAGDSGDDSDDNDSGDDSDDSDDSDDDHSSGEEDSQLEAEREAVTAATEEILQEIEDTRDVCRQFDSQMAAASLAADYQRSDDAFAAAQGVASTMHASTQSFLHSGDQTYSGVRHLLNDRQQTLRERFARESAREVGDPVRISDGHFTFEVPLPVIDHWEISVDLTLRYDGARSERSAFGQGWWWEPAQRVVPGVRPLPPMEPVLAEFSNDLAEARSVLSTAYSDTFDGAPVVSNARDQLAILLDHWSAAAETYSELHESLTELLGRAGEDPVMEPVVSAALHHLDELTALQEQERARFSESLDFLHAWESGRSAVEHSHSTLTEEEERFARHRARYEGERATQATHLPSGAAAESFEIGSGSVAYFGERGALHSFFPQSQAVALTTHSLPWHTLSGTESSGYAIETPSGTRRIFSNSGRLVRIEDGAGHALIFERDSQGRLTTIRDELGQTRASFDWRGATCEIDIPTMDPTTVDVDQGVIRRVAGPRGSLTLEYEGGLLSRILRADGSWTSVAREPGARRRVVAVEQSTGAVERVRYESDDRRVYVDPDGYETIYEITGNRVRSVTFPSGLRRWYEYDRRRRLISWSDNRGGGERLSYDDHGARTAVERSNGTWHRVQRDPQGRVLRVESDRGTLARYRYHADGTVAETTDATGYTRTFTHLPGRALRITSRGRPLAQIQLDPRGNPVEIQRSDGRHERRVFDELNRLTEVTVDGVSTVVRTYDPAGRLASITTADGLVTYRYGATGNPVEIRRNDSTVEHLRYDSIGNRTGRTFHDGTEEEIQRTPAGRITAMHLRDGSQWRVTYDAGGRPVEIREESGARRREFAYARDGRVLSTFSHEEGLVEYLYDSYGGHIGYRYGDGSLHRRHVHPGGHGELETPEGESLEIDLDAADRPRRIRSDSDDPLIYRYRVGTTEVLRGSETVRREEVDRFGRLRAIHYPDGTSETWSYADGGRTRVFTDRRGAVHREERDHWHRPVAFTASDGYQVRWTYAGEWVHETRSDGTSRRYRRDAMGAVTEEHSPTAVVRRISADRGAHRIETHTPDGQLLERLTFDGRQRLVEQWSRIGGAVHSVAYRPEGVQEYRLLGYRERREDTIPGMESVHRRDGAAAVRVARTAAGLPRQVQSDDNYSALISWIAPGFPAEVVVRHGDHDIRQRYTYRNNRLTAYELSGVPRRTYDTADSGQLVTIRCGDGARAITTDPYGKIVTETIQLPELPTITSRHRRDRHGRVQVTETDIDHTPGISRQTIRYVPHRRGARVTADSITLEVLDDDSETTLTIDEEFTVTVSPDTLQVADILTIRTRHGVEGRTTQSTVEQSRGSGFEAVLDAAVQVRNELGQIVAEQRIDGYTQTFEYDTGGRLTAASGGPGGVITAVEPAVSRALTESWRLSGVSVAPPEPPRSVNQHELLYAAGAATGSDGAGRIVTSQGTILAYDETSGRPQRITNNRGRTWTMVRDATGNPVLIGDSAGERRWVASTVDYPTRGGPLQVRSWTESGSSAQRSVARYRPGSRETAETAGAERSAESCVEVSRNGQLLLVADQDAIYVPYSDARGTTRGLAQINRATRTVHYQAWPTVLPEVDARGIGPSGEGPQFPSALPYDRMVYGMLHLPDTDVLWGVERAYLPALGRFTTIDPALHHLDWFSYAAGDPVNFTDAEGLRFIPINAGHTHFQQQGWWNEDPLGDRGTVTVGSSGCVLTGVSNMINTISGTSASDPGTLNWYCRDGFYREGNLLATEDTAEILQAATGHHIETISFDPQTVDMNRVASAIQDDTIQQYAATARIRTYRTNADGSIDEYQHTVNVAGFDEHGQPIIHDTSTRNRTALDHREEVVRYDVYAVSNCRGY